MKDENSMSDEQFLSAFLDSRIPPEHFNHLGHIRAAWLLLQRRALPDAVKETCDGIRRLATRLGVPEKYHCTLTEAMVRLMAQGGASDPALSFDDFLAANAELVHDSRSLLARHYSPASMSSPAARERFLPPDRLPLPA